MITIFHNPRCRKSRECLSHIETSGKEFTVINYVENPPNVQELKNILKKLDIKPLQLIRQKEKIWIDYFKGKTLTDEKLIELMVEYPILIERPIVIVGNKAVIARPFDKALAII